MQLLDANFAILSILLSSFLNGERSLKLRTKLWIFHAIVSNKLKMRAFYFTTLTVRKFFLCRKYIVFSYLTNINIFRIKVILKSNSKL